MQALEVSYASIINPQSAFSRSFSALTTRQEKINHFLTSFCQQTGPGTFAFKIKDIPKNQGLGLTKGTINVSLQEMSQIDAYVSELQDLTFPPYSHYIPILTSNSTDHFILLTFNNDSSNNISWFYENPGALVGSVAQFQNVSGSTFMRLFDALSTLCSVGPAMLWDRSKLHEVEEDIYYDYDFYENFIQLRVLYPYIYGQTFYERFGFIPLGLTNQKLQEYYQTRKFLIDRPLKEVLSDFAANPDVYNALLEGFKELRYFPEHNKPLEQATIKDALYVPYIRIKSLSNNRQDPVTHFDQVHYIQILTTIYNNCLISYLCGNAQKQQFIENLQEKVHEIEYFYKFYN